MHVATVVFLVLLFSCNSSNKINTDILSQRWIAASSIEIQQNFRLDQLIEKPKNIFNPLIKIGFFNHEGEKFYDCLYFKVSSSNKAGEFKVIKNPKNLACEKITFEKDFFRIQEIFNFKLNIKKNVLQLYVDKQVYEFQMLNYGAHNNAIYKGAIKDTKFKGVSFFSNITDSPVDKKTKIADKSVCLKVNDLCEESENKCSNCFNGWYEVMNSKCSTKYSRVCGLDLCGSKGEAACLRGIYTVGVDTSLYCINDSPFGFCKDGLRVFCENATLICK